MPKIKVHQQFLLRPSAAPSFETRHDRVFTRGIHEVDEVTANHPHVKLYAEVLREPEEKPEDPAEVASQPASPAAKTNPRSKR